MISNSLFLMIFGRVEIFKIRYFHFWGLYQKSARSEVLFWSLEHDFQVSSIYLKKTVGGDIDFKVYFREIAIEVRAHNEIVCIFAIWKFNKFGLGQYFFILKIFLIAAILLYKKKQKSKTRPWTPLTRN